MKRKLKTILAPDATLISRDRMVVRNPVRRGKAKVKRTRQGRSYLEGWVA